MLLSLLKWWRMHLWWKLYRLLEACGERRVLERCFEVVKVLWVVDVVDRRVVVVRERPASLVKRLLVPRKVSRVLLPLRRVLVRHRVVFVPALRLLSWVVRLGGVLLHTRELDLGLLAASRRVVLHIVVELAGLLVELEGLLALFLIEGLVRLGFGRGLLLVGCVLPLVVLRLVLSLFLELFSLGLLLVVLVLALLRHDLNPVFHYTGQRGGVYGSRLSWRTPCWRGLWRCSACAPCLAGSSAPWTLFYRMIGGGRTGQGTWTSWFGRSWVSSGWRLWHGRSSFESNRRPFSRFGHRISRRAFLGVWEWGLLGRAFCLGHHFSWFWLAFEEAGPWWQRSLQSLPLWEAFTYQI